MNNENQTHNFKEEYKLSMDKETMSPELKSRILTAAEEKKQTNHSIRYIKPIMTAAMTAAACFVLFFTANEWFDGTESTISVVESASSEYSMESDLSLASEATEPVEQKSFSDDSSDLPSSESIDSSDTEITSSPSSAVYRLADELDSEELTEPQSDISESSTLQSETQNIPSESKNEPVQNERIPPSVLGASIPASELSDSEKNNDENSSVEASFETSEDNSLLDDSSALSEENAPAVVSDEAETTFVPNPITSYETISDAETVLGWKVKTPALEGASFYLISESLFEVDWENGDYYRMAITSQWGTDISGDYRPYRFSMTETLNGITVTLSGNESDSYNLLIWQDGEYSFAFYSSSPLTLTEAETLLKSIS